MNTFMQDTIIYTVILPVIYRLYNMVDSLQTAFNLIQTSLVNLSAKYQKNMIFTRSRLTLNDFMIIALILRGLPLINIIIVL